MGTKWTVIYESRQVVKARGPKHGSKKLGILFLGLSLIGILLFITPILTGELTYRIDRLTSRLQEQKTVLSGFGELLWLDERGIPLPVDRNFGLLVPSLGINIKVSHPGDIANQESYKNEETYKKLLAEGAVHADETALPNEPGTTYIFGHSTDSILNILRYNAVFYPLQYIKEGDDIVLFYNGQAQPYKVQEKKIVEADDTDYSSLGTADKRLVLQTCWPPGTTWKRLVVIAHPIENEAKSLLGLDFESI